MTLVTLDVRPLLAAGEDPLDSVVAAATPLTPEDELVLEAPFNPLPLRKILARIGFSSEALSAPGGMWRIACRRDGRGALSGPEEGCAGLPAEAPLWREDGQLHMDVRGLAMPLPLRAILRLAGTLDHAETVIIHHERDPLFLYAELAELGWRLERLDDAAPGELRFRLIWGH
ncbi:hypothetical protein GALL_155330 [mine drainage metagenome]|uniref:DUF2249 domain-containing protein n=1 Tax=mine drainage metagenome TaxID=410659 RepID=A0A1J5SEB3_9ZZZZ